MSAPDQETLEVSVISSVYNEEKSLLPLVERTVEVMSQSLFASQWEMILVNDASEDSSGRVLEELALRFPQVVRMVHHPQRRGQKGCFMTGFAHARGRISVLMDADLQVLPEELPRLLEPVLRGGQEMVCTYQDVKRGGNRVGLGRAVSQIGNLFMKLLFHSPVRDAGANFMAVSTRYLRGVRLIANDQRYLLPISMRRGLRRVTEVGCLFKKRTYGRSKYSYLKKALLGVPEMLGLKRRLQSGFYDHPPVLPETAGVSPPGEIPRVSWQQDLWDSQVLGVPAGRMTIALSSGVTLEKIPPLEGALSEALEEAKRRGIRFLSIRIPEESTATLHAAQAVGFRVVESYLTFERLCAPLSLGEDGQEPTDFHVRAARPEEAQVIADLAQRGFRHHRYLSDPLIPEERGRYSRRLWVINAFQGRADAIYVAQYQGQIAGFVILRTKTDSERGKVGGIDLLAVDEFRVGLGLGKALVAQGIRHYAPEGIPVEVGTQGKNVPAVRLYSQMGFRLKRTEISLHWHLEDSWPSSG